MIRMLSCSFAALVLHASVQAQELFSLDFPGGPMSAYVEAILEANPEADILVDEKIALFPITRTKLTNVDLRASLDLYSGSRIATPDGVMELYVRATPIGNTGDHIVRLIVEQPVSVADEIEVNVWSLRSLTSLGVSVEDALSAIQTTLSVAPHEAVMKYHEQTRLLIVSGNHRNMKLVDATLAALSEDASQSRQLTQNSQFRIAEMQYELAEAEADMQLATQQMNYSVSRIEQGESEVEAGVLEEGALLELRLDLARSERDLYVAQQRVDLIREQLSQFKESTGTR